MAITVKLLDPKHPSANYQVNDLYSHLFHALYYFQVASHLSDRLYRVAALGNSAKRVLPNVIRTTNSRGSTSRVGQLSEFW